MVKLQIRVGSISLLCGVATAILMAACTSSFATDWATAFKESPENSVFRRESGVQIVTLDASDRTIMQVEGTAIGKINSFAVVPRARYRVEFTARNAAPENTIEQKPVLEQFLRLRMLRQFPVATPFAQVVYYDADDKLTKVDPTSMIRFRTLRIYSGQWERHVFEGFVPDKMVKMSVWFYGADTSNRLQMCDFSFSEVKDAPTLNVNPELDIGIYNLSGYNRLQGQIGTTENGRMELHFNPGLFCTDAFPVESGTTLKVTAHCLKRLGSSLYSITFYDDNMEIVGKNKTSLRLPGEETVFEIALPIPENGRWATVFSRNGTLCSLHVVKEEEK